METSSPEFESPIVELSDNPDRELLVSKAIKALSAARSLDLMVRGGGLVRVLNASELKRTTARRDANAPVIRSMPLTRLAELTGRCVRWMVPTMNGPREKAVPQWLAEHIRDRGEWPGLPRLRSLTASPLVLADGSITPPGYDHDSGIWYVAHEPVEVPTHPTQADARAAVAELLEVVQDFPFATDGDRGAWICCVLSPLAVLAFEGPIPLFLFEASVQGSGKSIAAQCASIIATGRGAALLTPTSDVAEERKRITSLALAGDPTVLYDNASGILGNDALSIALTSPDRMWGDRKLGQNENALLPLDAVFMATSNNARLVTDMLRRTVVCRLEPQCERPETRTGFRHSDLLAWVRSERPRLLRAALIVLRAYQAAGRPHVQLAPLGSYEGWSAAVRAAAVWAGACDPLCNRERTLAVADSDGDALAALLAALAALPQPFTASAVVQAAPMGSALREALVGDKEPTARRVGGVLNKYRGRVSRARKLVCEQHPTTRVTVWRVAEVPQGPEASEPSEPSTKPFSRESGEKSYGLADGSEPSDSSEALGEAWSDEKCCWEDDCTSATAQPI